jgi:hypothetical protein
VDKIFPFKLTVPDSIVKVLLFISGMCVLNVNVVPGVLLTVNVPHGRFPVAPVQEKV